MLIPIIIWLLIVILYFIDVLKYVSDIVPLDKVQDAYLRLTSGTDSAIKILVDPQK